MFKKKDDCVDVKIYHIIYNVDRMKMILTQ